VQLINPWSKRFALSNAPTLRNQIQRMFIGEERRSCALGRGLVAAALIAASAVLGVAFAQSLEQVGRFEQVPSDSVLTSTFKPSVITGLEPIHVVVIMSADSVAVARSKAIDHKIGVADADAVQKAAIAQQSAIKPLLAAKGAKVLAQFQYALNGIKVEVAKSKVAELAALPGVVSVLPVGIYHLQNVHSVPFIGAPLVWQGVPGYRGENVKIAIIDTGIDYTHANFGGPGTVAAFNAAAATSTAPANPLYFGPSAPKVKGGTDLVGDSYNPTPPSLPTDPPYQPTPQPDPNPLDCNGHGSHTAGTAAGFGVLNNATYTGPYNSAAYQQAFQIGPGVAPKANLYAVRVFGCAGSTEVVTEAIEWAVQNGMDVISMSLGADFGRGNSADAVAAQNAVLAGITVVAASGNSAFAPYITSSPGTGSAVITAAAMDGTVSISAANVALSSGRTIVAQNSNLNALPSGSLPIVVLRNPDGTISFACNESEFPDALVANKLVVTQRGSTCARIDRATFGARHGAAAVALINNADGYPPIEGPIPNVSIPFLGVLMSDGAALAAAASATLSPIVIPNPGYETTASFSSSGPRFGDSLFKPSVTAPGVNVYSTLVGSGTGGVFESGTSMATPHIAGVAALVRQAHPGWTELAQRAAITQTADSVQKVAYAPRLDGAGVLQALPATATQAFVVGTADAPDPLSFGFTEVPGFSLNSARTLTVHNNGTTPIQFTAKVAPAPGTVAHVMGLGSSSIAVPALGDATLPIKLAVQAINAGLTHPAGTNNAFHDVAGTLTLTPTDPSMNGGAKLTIPYYMVTRARSLVQVSHNVPSVASPNSTLTVTNPNAWVSGTADFYAWGLSGTPQGNPFVDTRAVGVQSFPSGNDATLVFAVNTFNRVSNFAGNLEWDILIDNNNDGIADFVVVGFNIAGLISGQPSGRFASAVFNARTGAIVSVRFYADSPTDNTTFLLPAMASDLGVTGSNPRFTYQVVSFEDDGTASQMPGSATFNAFNSAISTGMFATVAPGQSAPIAVTINPTEWAKTPALGVMAVSMDNLNGTAQADLIPIPVQ